MYQVMRMIKIKRTGVYGVGLERKRDEKEERNFAYSDIDPTRTQFNQHIITTENWNKEITRQIKDAGCKEKKDSVVLVGALFTASEEFFEKNPKYVPEPLDGEDNRTTEQKQKWLHNGKTQQFFDECLAFCVEHCCGGNIDQIIDATIDYDEKTPHLQIYFVPLVQRAAENGEPVFALSAKEVFGNRTKLREYQDKLHAEVGQKYGFDRGVKVEWDKPYEERRKHQKTMQHRRAEEAALTDRVLDLKNDIATMEQTHQRVRASIDILQRELQAGNADVAQVQQELEELTNRYERFEKNLQQMRGLENAAEQIARDGRSVFKPHIYETHAAKKKPFSNEVIKPETVEISKDDYDRWASQPQIMKSDVWEMSRINREIGALKKEIENPQQAQQLAAAHNATRSREIELRKTQQELSNIKYELRQLQQALRQNPTLYNKIQQIIDQPTIQHDRGIERK